MSCDVSKAPDSRRNRCSAEVVGLGPTSDSCSAAVYAPAAHGRDAAHHSLGTGRFNLTQGIVGSATGIGAALSTTAAGYLADNFGTATAFFGLAVAGLCAFLLLASIMPETKP